MHQKNPAIILVIFIFISTIGILNVVADDQVKKVVGLERPSEDYYGRKLLNSRVLNTADVYSTVQITSDKCETTSTGLGIRQKIPENECRAYAHAIGEEFGSVGSAPSLPEGCYKLKANNIWYYNSYSSYYLFCVWRQRIKNCW